VFPINGMSEIEESGHASDRGDHLPTFGVLEWKRRGHGCLAVAGFFNKRVGVGKIKGQPKPTS
jgi:hypothetical protein